MRQIIDMNEQDKNINQFLDMVRGRVVEKRTIRSYEMTRHQYISMGDEIAPVSIISEDAYLVEIPASELNSMYEVHDWYRRNQGGYSMDKFHSMMRATIQEERARDDHPAVHEAWEKYQTLLALTK